MFHLLRPATRAKQVHLALPLQGVPMVRVIVLMLALTVTLAACGERPVSYPARTAPAYLFWRVEVGKTVEPYLARGSVMPAWRGLTDGESWQLVASLKTWSS